VSTATAEPVDTSRQAMQERHAALQSLFAALEHEPWAFDFFATLRRIEALTPQNPRIGTAPRPQLEALRLGQEPELDFAPAALARFRPAAEGPPRLTVRFFGLLGPQGPMPLHLTEYARERMHNRADPTLARFLDVFHHRMLTLMYRAWAQTQPTVQRDRPADDRYAAWLGASFGLGRATAGRDSVPDSAKLFQAGLLGTRSRHPEGLAKILSQYFGVPARVQSHVPHWLSVHDEDRSRLGFARNRRESVGLQASRLGHSATAGSKVFDRQHKFRIVLGPLTLAQYEGFLPGQGAWQRLRDWVRLYVGHDLLWDVELCLRHAEKPSPRLGRVLRLGLTSWIGPTDSRPGRRRPPRDRGDLHLRSETTALPGRHGVHHG
jgi:type VI secretion system protein ImpH